MAIDTDHSDTSHGLKDLGGFKRLVNTYSRRVHAIAYRMTGNSEDAKDIAQDVFLRLFSSSDLIADRVPAGAWLYRTTVNRSIDYLRGRKKRMSVPIDETAETGGIPHPDSGPDVRMEQKEAAEKIRALLGLLSPNQRSVFVLRDFEDFNTGEIADILECSQATVRVHLAQARRKVKDALIKRYPGLVTGYDKKRGELR